MYDFFFVSAAVSRCSDRVIYDSDRPANTARLYTATTPTNDQARASINSVGLLAAMQGQGPLGWYFRSITWQDAQHLKAADQQTIVVYYNGINHFESVKMS